MRVEREVRRHQKGHVGGARACGLQELRNSISYSFDRLTRAVGGLLDRAVAAGEIRDDISPEDLLRALVGMCYMHDQPGWQASVLRLVDVFVDGLRVPLNKSKQREIAAMTSAQSRS